MLPRITDSEEIAKLESSLVRLLKTTFLKGAIGKPGPRISTGVNRAFSDESFKRSLDKIFDSIVIESVEYADSEIEDLDKGEKQASRISEKGRKKRAWRTGAYTIPKYKVLQGGPRVAATKELLPLTEEGIKQAKGLSKEVSESLIRFLKDENIYTQHPNQLEKSIRDLWDNQKYKAVRFARTITADIAVNTTVTRYQQMGIKYLQFYAKIDDRTTNQCRCLHGTIIPSNSSDIHQYRPPLHHQCRSALLPLPRGYTVNEDLLIQNRDFTRHVNQDLKFIPGRIDQDTALTALDMIDSFNEKYRVSQFILNEDIESRLMKLNISVVGELPKGRGKAKPKPDTQGPGEPEKKEEEKKLLIYKDVTNRPQAERWLKGNTEVEIIELHGLDVEVINEMNHSLTYHINLAPELKSEVKYFGTIQGHFTAQYETVVKQTVEKLMKTNITGQTREEIEEEVRKVFKKKVAGREYAHYWDLKGVYDENITGVAVNRKWGGHPDEFIKSLKYGEETGFHPTGCGTIKSVMDHEFGHAVDNLVKLNKDPEIVKLYESLSAEKIKKDLSGYANTNIHEFIAEGWSEYLNNPTPRDISMKIGNAMIRKLEELKK